MPPDPPDDYGTIAVTHHAMLHGRDRPRRRAGTKPRPECTGVGHVWVFDRDREGWQICLVCQGVKAP